jgi:hypothetical protein
MPLMKMKTISPHCVSAEAACSIELAARTNAISNELMRVSISGVAGWLEFCTGVLVDRRAATSLTAASSWWPLAFHRPRAPRRTFEPAATRLHVVLCRERTCHERTYRAPI